RGSANLMGFDLMRNFRHPYFARNVSDFWTRWHISLSTWLRDYLYISLGGNRKGTARTYINLMITMLLGGLWHGASWNFVIWGAMHGLLLIAYRKWQRPRSLFVTQLFILFTWIAFRLREPHAMLIAMRKFVLFDFDFALAGR